MLFNACNAVSRKLSAYMDGELSQANQAAVKEHICACADCAAELRRFSAVDTGIRSLPLTAPPAFFPAKVSAAARALGIYHGPFHGFLRLPMPAMAAMVAFILVNLFTFAFNINAMENGLRRELARKVVAQLAKPASIINPVALARLCGECSKYMCLCMHETAKKSICSCKNCEMEKARKAAGTGNTGNIKSMEEHNVH